jgi:Fe-S-cluster containining protein
MGNLTPDDMRQLAPVLGITRECVSNPVPIDVSQHQCKRCGACCRHQDGIVVSLNDAQLLARRLRVPLKRFIHRYCQETRLYDIFGHGPYKGIAIKTSKGTCPFYSDREGCTVNDAKPTVCRLYPFNTIHVTRASILKIQRRKDGSVFDGCYVFDLDNAGVARPDFEALAALCIQLETTREYYRLCGDRWQEDMAKNAIAAGARLSGDEKSVGMYAGQLRAAFDELDRMNGEILLETLADGK